MRLLRLALLVVGGGFPSCSAYSFSRYWILRALMPSIDAAREVLPSTTSRVRRMASRSISRSVAPGMKLPARGWLGEGPLRTGGKSSAVRSSVVASTTARSMTFSSSRTLPGQS